MGILRAGLEFEGQYTQVPNDWARDARLSRRARGLLTEILSHRVGWRLTIEGLAKNGPEGKHAIRTAVDELREAGYLEVEQVRRTGGQFGEVEYRLTDPTASRKSGTGGFAASGSPADGSPADGKSNTREEHLSEDHLSEDDVLFVAPVETTVSFDEFYFAYPRKVGRAAAQKAWAKAIRSASPSVILEGARRYAADPNLPPKQYIPHPASWLNAGRWDDEPEAAREGATPAGEFAAGDEWMEFGR